MLTRLIGPICCAVALVSSSAPAGRLVAPLSAASSAGCEGGGFTVVLPGGRTIAGDGRTTALALELGDRFLVRGKYVEFQIVAATFGIVDYAFTGAPNALD